MKQPKISVIVPIYNAEPYLPKCLNSIVTQTYRNLEIILIDDGSPDNCGTICDEYAAQDARIQVIHTKNRGPFAARNLALDVATGDFIGFVDADDWIDPYMYETLLNLALKYSADIAQCEAINEGAYIQIRSKCEEGISLYRKESLTLAFFREAISHGLPTKLFNSKIWSNHRFAEGHYHTDAVFLSDLDSYCDIFVCTGKALYHYNTACPSITRGRKTALHLYSTQALFDAYSKAAKKAGPIGNLFLCREIPCRGRMILPSNDISFAMAAKHVRHMHRIFLRHWIHVKTSSEYKSYSKAKRILWNIYSRSPLFASLLVYTYGSIRNSKFFTTLLNYKKQRG